MGSARPIWRHTSVFFVSQLVILVCAGLYLVQWSYTEGQKAAASMALQPDTTSAAATFQVPGATEQAAIEPSASFWNIAAMTLKPFLGTAFLILLGSSALFFGYELICLNPSSTDTL